MVGGQAMSNPIEEEMIRAYNTSSARGRDSSTRRG